MSDTSAPLTGDQVDELLSADLDGEFDAAARDLGLDPAMAREQLEATPGIETRRDAMGNARDLLSQVPEYDELVGARLRAKANKEGERAHERERAHRRSRWLTAVGAAAAAIVLVVGVGYALQNNNDSSASKSAASAPAAAPTTVPRTIVLPNENFGSAANPSALADALRQPTSSLFYGDTASSAAVHEKSTNTATYRATAGSSNLTSGLAVPPTACAKEAKSFAATTSEPIRSGTATVGGKKVIVALYLEGRSNVLVILTPKCGLLYQQTWPTTP